MKEIRVRECNEIMNREIPGDQGIHEQMSLLLRELQEREAELEEFVAALTDRYELKNAFEIFIEFHKHRICELLRRIQSLGIDSLTSLHTRHRFEDEKEKLNAMLDRGIDLGFIMLDIDNFKPLNDRYGHPCGDAVLTAVGSAIKESIRKYDLGFRYGGEEFFLIIYNVDGKKALKVANKILASIAALRVPFEDSEVSVTASAGVCSNGSSTRMSIDEMVACADEALYQAKAVGKNTAVARQEPLRR